MYACSLILQNVIYFFKSIIINRTGRWLIRIAYTHIPYPYNPWLYPTSAIFLCHQVANYSPMEIKKLPF